jgi:hypothetical protein
MARINIQLWESDLPYRGRTINGTYVEEPEEDADEKQLVNRIKRTQKRDKDSDQQVETPGKRPRVSVKNFLGRRERHDDYQLW